MIDMFRRVLATISAKCSLATLLLAFSLTASAGPMRCMTMGMPMEPPVVAEVAVPMAPDHSCCKSKAEAKAPEPVKQKAKCCCIDVLKKNILDMGQGKIADFQIEFPILVPPASSFDISEQPVVVQQVRWPEVHGPPVLHRDPPTGRAPPVA